jgi:hypothetical protein
MFPMLVKHLPRIVNGMPVDSLMLGPLTHFAGDDDFTFSKHQLIFYKEMDHRYISEYHRSVDEFCQAQSDLGPMPADVEELERITQNLKKMFKEEVNEEEIDSLPSIHVDTSKLIH